MWDITTHYNKEYTIMKHCPIILSIAGSDCSGGAGIQADIKTISALGGYAASVITAVTSQNTLGVQGVYTLPPEVVAQQIRSVMSDLKPHAVKIGMVAHEKIVQVIADCLDEFKPKHVVYDPVMVSTSGRKLMTDEAIRTIRKELFPRATLITPNLDEVSLLTGRPIHTTSEMVSAGLKFAQLWHTALLVKGGHLEGDKMTDVLCTEQGESFHFESSKIASSNLHGTGCTLSSAIAAHLAMHYDLRQAVELGKSYVSRAIEAGADLEIGSGNGPLCHFFAPFPTLLTD